MGSARERCLSELADKLWGEERADAVGPVANRPVYVALAVTTEGRREILGLRAGDGGEGAKHWLHILTEIKNRGVGDVLMPVCDGL